MTGFSAVRAARFATVLSMVVGFTAVGCGADNQTEVQRTPTATTTSTAAPVTQSPTTSAETRTLSGNVKPQQNTAPASGGEDRGFPEVYSVSGSHHADFASATGQVWCTLADSGYAACMVPSGTDAISWPTDYCADEVDVVGIRLDTKVGFDCSTDAYIQPDLPENGGNLNVVNWFFQNNVGDKLTSTTGAGQGIAVLPPGDTMQRGDIACTANGDTISCTNSKTNASFAIAQGGLQTSGEQWDKEQGFQLSD